MRAPAIFLGLSIALAGLGPLARAESTVPPVTPLSIAAPAPLLIAQTDTGERTVPQVGQGQPKKNQKAAAPVVIPPPPPFPEHEEDSSVIWAIAGVSIVVLGLIVLIVLMVRRDAAKKRSKKTTRPARRREPGAGGAGSGNTTISGTTMINTVGPTLAPSEPEPLTVIQTQWRDISENTGSRPNLNLELIEADADMQQSFREAGYNPFYQKSDSGIEVAEMAHSLPEVEVLIQMGLEDHAILMLESMMAENEYPKPQVWLLLFDLYVRAGTKEKYDQLAKGFKTYFNAIVPDWSSANSANLDQPRALEAYPAVINKIVRLWGLPSGQTYLESLIHDNRNGTRVGFSLAAYTEIIFLFELAETLRDWEGQPLTDEDLGFS